MIGFLLCFNFRRSPSRKANKNDENSTIIKSNSYESGETQVEATWATADASDHSVIFAMTFFCLTSVFV